MSLTNPTKRIEQNTKQSESNLDIYSLFQEILQTYFKEIRENASSYLQAVSDVQEEIIEARRKNAENIISLQKATFEKLGGGNTIPSTVIDLAKSYAEQATQTWNLQNKMILTSLDTLSRNIEVFNKNSATFEDINKKLIDFWTSAISQK